MKNNILILHFGELSLKGKNYFYFLSKMMKNIKQKLNKYKSSIEYIKEYKRLYINVLDNNILENIILELKTIFGISSISIAKKCKNNIEDIKKLALTFFETKKNKTFKLEIKRKNKSFEFNSMELKNILGKIILQNYKKELSVKLDQPDILLMIEVRDTFTLMYYHKIPLLGGLPFCSSGKAISMISGGIDSPVASFLTMKKGMKIDFVYFFTPPHTEEKSLKKVIDLIKQIKKYANDEEQNLYVVDFSLLQNEIMHILNESYRITIMRRMFYRITSLIAQKNKINTIITGESLGQVASQTIESISVISSCIDTLVIRPLVTYDKNDIIKIAKSIGTYDISILPFEDCCSLFVPKNPITKPRVNIAIKNESQILYKELINEILKNNIKIIKI